MTAAGAVYGDRPRAASGRTVGLTALDRAASIADQAIVSASNLLLTLTLARAYEPVCLAGFAIGSTLALVLQGVYRSTFVLPASLLELGLFRARAGRLAAQHIVVMAAVSACAAVASAVAAGLDPTPLGLRAAAASMACVLLFASTDFDRILLLRLGFRALPLAIAVSYLALLGTLAFAASRQEVSFFTLMTAIGGFSLAKMTLCATLPAKPDFRDVAARLRINFRRNFHWGAISNLAASGYASAPVILLSWSAPALNVAAYNAMRNLTQPLQLILRSFDIIDKLIFSTLDRSDAARQRSHILFVLTLYAALSVAFTAMIAVGGTFLTKLAYGERYDHFGSTLVFWSLVTGLTCCLAPLETVIYRTGQLKVYALLQLCGAAVALLSAWPLVQELSDFGAVTATLIGTAIVFSGLLAICAPFLGLGETAPAAPLLRAGPDERTDDQTYGLGRALRDAPDPVVARAGEYQRIHTRAVNSQGSEAQLSEGRRMLENSLRRSRQGAAPFADRELDPAPSDDVARFLSTLRRHRGSIAAVSLILPVVVLAATFAFPFRYTAWSEISIDPRGQKTTESDIVPSGYGNDIAISDSQIKIITSDAVLLPVVRDLHLADDPDFRPGLVASLSSRLADLLGRQPRADEDRDLDALRTLRTRVTAKRAERTYIIDIGVSSPSPDGAAALTRAVAQSYMADHQRAETATVKSVAGFLSSRLDDMRTSLIDAEKQVEDYKEHHDLVAVNDVPVTEQRLSDLNTQLATASVHVAEAQGRFEAISRIRAMKGDPGALTAALNSPVINELRKQAAEAARSEAVMAATLGPRHPALYEAHQQTTRVKALIAEELNRIYESAGADLAIAHGDEKALKSKIATLQTATQSTNRALVGLRQLEREVEARRTLYQAFLSRAQAAGEQEGATVSNLRVISPATVPDRRDGPGRPVLAIVALLMGALIGVGQALFRDRGLGRGTLPQRPGRPLEAGPDRGVYSAAP